MLNVFSFQKGISIIQNLSFIKENSIDGDEEHDIEDLEDSFDKDSG